MNPASPHGHRINRRSRSARSAAAASVVLLSALAVSGCSSTSGTGDAAHRGGATWSATVGGPALSTGSETAEVRAVRLRPALDHVHGLLATGDGTLLAGTHSGVAAITRTGSVTAVGSGADDLMGMMGIPGTDQLISSGHPGEGSDLPNPLGLIASDDGGTTWTSVSLSGEVDFHALATSGGLVVGYDGRAGLLVSTDGGATFTPGARIAPVALAITPGGVWATTADGLQRSTDTGRTFTSVAGAPLLVLVASGTDASLWGVDTDGAAWSSPDGTTWDKRGRVGPVEALAAFDHALAYAVTSDTLYVLT